MSEGKIDGEVYPIAVGDRGETLWQTTDVAQERDEMWDDWSAGIGETKRETGRGYLFSRGFDATAKGALRPSPFYQAHNNTALTTGRGYFMEDVETTGSTLNLDAYSTGKGSVVKKGTLTWAHTVASQDERIILVFISIDIQAPGTAWPLDYTITYDGAAMTRLSWVSVTADAGMMLFSLLAPATGSNNVVVKNHSKSTRAIVGGAVSLYGVNEDTPFGTAVTAAGTDGTPAATVSTTAGEFVLAGVGVAGSATIAAGASETERWDDTQESTVSGAGYTQAGSNGGVMAPNLSVGTNWVEIVVPIKPASTSSRSAMWLEDTDKIFKYTYDADSGPTETVLLAGTADSATASTLVDATPGWSDDDYNRNLIEITGGTGVGQRRSITDTVGGATDRLDITPNWDVTPDGTSTYNIYTSVYIASGVAGRPAKMNAKWYAPMASGTNARKLDDATGGAGTTTWADAGWKADHLATYQKGIQPTLARANSATQNTIELNADTSGDVGDTWTNESEEVGNTSAKITDIVEVQGLLLVAKEDNLYRFGSEAESFPIIPFLGTGKIDPDNGKGLDAFGDEVIYPSKGNLWRHRIGGGSLPIGVNTIEGWRKVDAIPTPKDGRHVFEVHVEGYRYTLLNKGEESHLLQRRGKEGIFYSVLTIPLSNALGVDSLKRLWIKGASTDETKRDVRVIQLADDGSLDVENRKGQPNSTHDIYFDERNPGRPQDKVQIRHMTVELEGDWDATTSLQLKLWLDNATSSIDHGAAITAAGVTICNPTIFGTSDSAYRFRPQLTLTTNSSYAPKISDLAVLRVIVGIRFPEIIRIVIPADDGVLKGMTAKDAIKNLRRLQNQGVVNLRNPEDIATFSAEIFSVTDVIYATLGNKYGHGIEVRCRRWVTA